MPAPVPGSSRLDAARAGGLVVAGLAALGAVLASLRVGSLPVSTTDVLAALFDYDPSVQAQAVVATLRLPRTLIGIGVGASLAMAGALMQAATRNPFASPSILGVSRGAAFAVVVGISYFGLGSPLGFTLAAFIGGFAAVAVVFAIGSVGAGGASPVKLTLAGVIVSALLMAWTTAILILDERSLDVVRFWMAGSLAGRGMDIFWVTLPFLVAGGAGALLVTHQLNVLGLGDDQARALGMRTGLVRAIVAIIVVVMAGAAVAAAGPIAFVGLAVPHIVRLLVGPDNRWVVPYSAFGGIILLLGADVLGRVLMRPTELPAGIVTAFIGAPFLIYLARRRRVADL